MTYLYVYPSLTSHHFHRGTKSLHVFVLLQVIDKSFGFDTAVEEAQRAINAAHVEAESIENGIGVVKLMGRFSRV